MFKKPSGLAWDKVLNLVPVQTIKSMSKPIKRCSIVIDGDESKLGCASDLTWLMLRTHQLPIHGKIVHSLNYETLKWPKGERNIH